VKASNAMELGNALSELLRCMGELLETGRFPADA
jgi:hypothetical protein